MADRRRKTVYEKIEDVKIEIQLAEERISQLNIQLNALELEKDELEMKKLFEHIRKNNITFTDAINILNK